MKKIDELTTQCNWGTIVHVGIYEKDDEYSVKTEDIAGVLDEAFFPDLQKANYYFDEQCEWVGEQAAKEPCNRSY